MDRQNMNRLESDIAIIKEAIRANNGFVRQFLSGRALCGFFIVFGAMMVGLGLIWHFALAMYGSFGAMSVGLQIIIIVVTVLAFASLVAIKLVSITRSARKIDQNYNWFDMVLNLSEHPISVAQGIVVLMSICCAIVAGRGGEPTILVGIVTGGLAVVFLLYAVAFILFEYLPISIGLFLVTVLAVLFPTMAPLLLLAGGMGGVFFVYGLVLQFFYRGEK